MNYLKLFSVTFVFFSTLTFAAEREQSARFVGVPDVKRIMADVAAVHERCDQECPGTFEGECRSVCADIQFKRLQVFYVRLFAASCSNRVNRPTRPDLSVRTQMHRVIYEGKLYQGVAAQLEQDADLQECVAQKLEEQARRVQEAGRVIDQENAEFEREHPIVARGLRFRAWLRS